MHYNRGIDMGCIIMEAYDNLEDVKLLFKEYAEMLGVDLSFQNFDEEIEGLPGKYGKPYGKLYLAYNDSKLAGCIALRRFDKEACEMKRLFVRPEFRGKKIGEKLVKKVIEDARLMGYKKIYLDTLFTLKNAVHLYRNLGFYEIPAYYNNPLRNVLYFSIDL